MKLVFVLPGGGACCRWQAGALYYFLTQLQALGVKPDLMCGTSGGGLNSLKVAKGEGPEALKALWAGVKSNKDIFNGMVQFNNIFDDIGMVSQTFKDNKGVSVVDPVGLYHLADKEFGNTELKDLALPVIIATTDMSTGERMAFSTAANPTYKCADLAKATSAIPLAFPGVNIYVNNQNDLHNDGGILRNNPVCYAIDAGATHIILIGTSPDSYPRADVKNNVLAVAVRLQDVIMHANEEESWEEKEDYEQRMKTDPTLPPIKFLDIYPAEPTGSALNFGDATLWDRGAAFAQASYSSAQLAAFLGSVSK